MCFAKILTPDSYPRCPPKPLFLESLKSLHLGEKVDFSRVGNMPNIHGNLEFFHFLYMFNWDLHKIINERTHYEHFLWRGKKREGGLAWKSDFFGVYILLLEYVGAFSANSKTPKRASLCHRNSRRKNHRPFPWSWVRQWAPGGDWKALGSPLLSLGDRGQCVLASSFHLPPALARPLPHRGFTHVYIGETGNFCFSTSKRSLKAYKKALKISWTPNASDRTIFWWVQCKWIRNRCIKFPWTYTSV